MVKFASFGGDDSVSVLTERQAVQFTICTSTIEAIIAFPISPHNIDGSSFWGRTVFFAVVIAYVFRIRILAASPIVEINRIVSDRLSIVGYNSL